MKRIHRCPWCGADRCFGTAVPFTRYYYIKCSKCGQTYVPDRRHFSFFVYLLLILIVMFSFSIMNMPMICITIISSLVVIFFVGDNCPYIKESNKFVTQKRQFAELNIYAREISHIYFHKYNIVENQIFTLCFIDENDPPISHMICAATESIKWYKKQSKCKCILAFLPLGKLEEPYPADTKFYMFYNDKKIGEGITGKVLEGMNEYC